MNFEKDIKSCIECLADGAVILYPSDTMWGLGCDATNPLAVKRLCQLKQKTDPNELIVLVANDRDLLKYVAAPDPLVFDLLESLNSPTTIIYESGIGLAENLLAEDGSVAIRVVKDEFCKHLVKRFGKPLVSASANYFGHSTPASFSEIDPALFNQVGYVVESFRNRPFSKPSTLLKWKTGSDPILIRP